MTSRPHRKHRIQHLVVIGVAFAFLLQMLAWSAMPVYAANADDDWIVICTSDGLKRVALTELDGSAHGVSKDSPSPVLVDHCELCVFAHGLGMAPTPAALQERVSRVLTLRIPAAVIAIPGKSHTPHQPRAPPVSV